MEFILFLLICFIYFLPTFIAFNQESPHKQVNSIFIVNLLLGWTLLGWVAALTWALNGNVKQNKNFSFIKINSDTLTENDIISNFEKLEKLKEQGLLTEEEFVEQKSKILKKSINVNTETNLKNESTKKSEKSEKRYVGYILTFIGILILLLFIGNLSEHTGSNSSNNQKSKLASNSPNNTSSNNSSNQENKPDLELIEHHVCNDEYVMYICGTVRNNMDRTYTCSDNYKFIR